jgi:transcriptional regulator with XRE-family HTH domain
MIIGLMTNEEILKLIALRVKNERLVKRLSQKELAIKANLALGTLQRFEQTGEISFSKLIKIIRSLDRINIFETFFNFEDEDLTLSYAQFKEKEKKKVKKRVFRSKKDDLELW